jgi:hypothetical protein
MSEFEDYIYQRLNQEMRSWNSMEAHDIYLIRMYIGLVDDDIRQGELSGPEYHTKQHLIESGSSEAEKWDSPAAHRAGFQLCEPFVEAWGNADKADPEGIKLRDRHLAAAGFLMTDLEYKRLGELWTKKNWNGRGGYEVFTPEDAAEEEQIEQRLEKIGEAFVDAVGVVIRHLHGDGVVQEVCGKNVPIVLELSNDFDALDNYTLKLVRQINPLGIADEYFAFHARHRGFSE